MSSVLEITVDNPSELLNAGAYGAGAVIRAQSSATLAGTYADLTGTGSTPTIAIVSGTTLYIGYDPGGSSTTWYQTRYENVGATRASAWSAAFQVSGQTIATVNDVRTILRANGSTVSTLADNVIEANLSAAEGMLERATNRYFANRVGLTLTFSTNGAPYIDLPGLRNITSATWPAGTTLSFTAGAETAWLAPDALQTGLYVGVQLRPFTRADQGGPWYLGVSQYWDRMLDSPFYPGNYGGGNGIYGSVPNDLVVTGDWGFDPASSNTSSQLALSVVRRAEAYLAGWLTLRPSGLLSNTSQTPDGNVFDLSQWPAEAKFVVEQYRIGGPEIVSL